MTQPLSISEVNRLVSENAALRERVEALSQERDRLREALERIAEHDGGRWIYGSGPGDPLILGRQQSEQEIARAALAASPHEPQGGSTAARPLHLEWRDGEWVDDRCTSDPPCRYHPDDDNNTHGGGPHVHACTEHKTGRIDIGPDLHDEPGYVAPSQDWAAVQLTRHSELRFGVEQHTFVAECGCVFEWDTTYDDPHWHQCAAHEPQEAS